jgi:hypothetical protein
MPAPNGLAVIGAPGTAAGFLNTPAFQRQAVFEMRRKSVFGPLSRVMKGKTSAADTTDRGIDPSKSAAVLVQELDRGSKVKWTMEKVLKGAPTFGDRVPEKGAYLDFLQAELDLNLVKSPAFQVKGEFEQFKQLSTLDGTDEARIKNQLILWNATYYAHDHYIAFLKGATDNLLSPTSVGGIGVNLGRGAGVQVSPMNILVRGSGFVGGATLAARESALKSAIAGLSTSTAGHFLTIEALQEISEEISAVSGKYEGIDMGGQEKFLLILPSIARLSLMGVGSTIADYSKYTMPLTADHPLFRFNPLQVGKIVVLFDDTLAKYSPDVTGSEVVWGKSTTNAQSWEYPDLSAAQKGRGIGLLMGAGSLLTANAKTMKFTEEYGEHEVGHDIATKTYRSIVRKQFADPLDSSALPVDQSSMLICFAMQAPKHGAT